MSGSFPTTSVAIIGFLVMALGAVGTYAGKLIGSLRDDLKQKDAELKAINEKVIDRIIPLMESTTRAGEAMTRAAERMTAPREPRSR